jgi:hypothetical protein
MTGLVQLTDASEFHIHLAAGLGTIEISGSNEPVIKFS